jgi:hypothetical protein
MIFYYVKHLKETGLKGLGNTCTFIHNSLSLFMVRSVYECLCSCTEGFV